ncbi:MAG: ImmA/IrrE family metallo-endopeptidase [Pseudanabaena sp.]|jgi:Zn-dependent peptidase ImmA (M78 family)
MTQTQLQMSDLYQRLDAIGFPKKYLQNKILPDWWTDDVDATSGVLVEGALYLSRRLNLDMRSLLGADTKPVFEAACQPKFKLKVGTNKEQLMIPRALSARIAEMVAYACLQPYQAIDGLSVADMRQQILAKREVVDLEGVLDFCWQYGIPVIHFSEFPSGVHKFDGMVAYFYQRPVILVSLKDLSPARLLFIIAHELGHILKGHIDSEGILFDESIEIESIDSEEYEANEVAGELLLGRSGISYYSPYNYNGDGLAAYAQRIADRDKVNSGLVVWNWGWYRKRWGVVRNALKSLEKNMNAPQQINRYLAVNLDWEKLGEENQDYLATMLGLNLEAVG